MDKAAKALVIEAKENPWRLFDCGEIGTILSANAEIIAAINRAADTPFVGKKCRPEWVIDWLRAHPGWTAK